MFESAVDFSISLGSVNVFVSNCTVGQNLVVGGCTEMDLPHLANEETERKLD